MAECVQQPLVSIIIPCRNEVRFIERCLDSVLATDYPKDRLEVLVIDGLSDDGTREILARLAARQPIIRVLDNPKRITPAALNIGVRAARGAIIMRMDAHATYAPNYISECVRALQTTPADNVGGRWVIVPRNEGLLPKAIAHALSHWFGVGGARYRLPTVEARWVDTVPYFCCSREVFEQVGLFNEALARGQDMEFSLRLRRHGLRTLLLPTVQSYYYARSDLVSYCRHNWTNGVWAVLPFAHAEHMPVAWRHLVPLGFVLGVGGSALLGLRWRLARRLCALQLAAYGAVSCLAAMDVARAEREPRYLVAMPLAFLLLHVPYGLGSLLGVLQLLRDRHAWRRAVKGATLAQRPTGSTGGLPAAGAAQPRPPSPALCNRQ